MADIGHNSAPYGETLAGDVETVLGDEHQKLFHYVQWHLSDYLTGTKGLTFEMEGAYMRFLANLYDRGKAFPDDDRFMAVVMATDIRKWRRIKGVLIEFGKVLIKNGCLTNARFERERVKRAEELRKQAENTRKYWEERRRKQEIERTSTQTSAELLPVSLPEVGEIEAKKVNKNNDSGKAPTSTPRDQRLDKKEESSELRSDADASVPDAAELVWGQGLEWLVKRANLPEKRCRALIGKWVKKSSAEVVLEAFRSAHRTKTEDPVPYITTIAEQYEAANHDCCWQDGQIQVFNGFAVQLQDLLGDRDLRKSIDRVSGKIPIAIKGPELQNKVRSLLVDLVERDREQTERYLKAASSNNANRPPSGSVPIKLDDSDRPKTKPRPREEVEA